MTLTDPTRTAEAVRHAAVRLTGVTKQFGTVQAVRGIDLELQQGEIVAFLGPNGAGKTTTIDMILGLSQPSSGSATVLGLQPRLLEPMFNAPGKRGRKDADDRRQDPILVA